MITLEVVNQVLVTEDEKYARDGTATERMSILGKRPYLHFFDSDFAL